MSQSLTHSQVQEELAKAKPANRYPVNLYLITQPVQAQENESSVKLFYLNTEIKCIEQLIELLQSNTPPQATLWNPELDRGTIDRYVRDFGVKKLKQNQSTPDLTHSQVALRNLAKKLGYKNPTDIARSYTPAEFIAEAATEFNCSQEKISTQYQAHLSIVMLNDELNSDIGDIIND